MAFKISSISASLSFFLGKYLCSVQCTRKLAENVFGRTFLSFHNTTLSFRILLPRAVYLSVYTYSVPCTVYTVQYTIYAYTQCSVLKCAVALYSFMDVLARTDSELNRERRHHIFMILILTLLVITIYMNGLIQLLLELHCAYRISADDEVGYWKIPRNIFISFSMKCVCVCGVFTFNASAFKTAGVSS